MVAKAFILVKAGMENVFLSRFRSQVEESIQGHTHRKPSDVCCRRAGGTSASSAPALAAASSWSLVSVPLRAGPRE